MHSQRQALGRSVLLLCIAHQSLTAIEVAAEDRLKLVPPMVQEDAKRSRDERQQLPELILTQDALAAMKTNDGRKAAIRGDKASAFVHRLNVAIVLHAHLHRLQDGDNHRLKFFQHDSPFRQTAR